MARLCKIRLFFNLECLHILEDTKECEVFLNTEVEEVQSTLQFSTSVEVRPLFSTLVEVRVLVFS